MAGNGDEEVGNNQIRLDFIHLVKSFKIPHETQQKNSI